MRTLFIPSTKAAKNRLSLLKKPEELAIPLDPKIIAPLGIRFQGDVLCVTFKNRDVAYAGRMTHDGKSFQLVVRAVESETIDRALEGVFKVLNSHLDRVGRVLAAEKRGKKTDKEKTEKDYEKEIEERTQAFFSEHQRFFLKHEDSVPVARLTVQDMRNACLLTSKKDSFQVVGSVGRPEFHLTFKDFLGFALKVDFSNEEEPQVTIRQGAHMYDGVSSIIQRWESEYNSNINAQEVFTEILRMSERNIRVGDVGPVITAIRELPEGDYDIRAAALNPMQRDFMTGDLISLGHGVDVTIGTGIDFYREGCFLAAFEFASLRNNADQIFIPERPKQCFRIERTRFLGDFNVSLTEDDYRRLGSFYLSEKAKVSQDPIYETYKIQNDEDLEREASMFDWGYAI